MRKINLTSSGIGRLAFLAALAILLGTGCGKNDGARSDETPAPEAPAIEATVPEAKPPARAAEWDAPAAFVQARENADRAWRGLDSAHRFLTFWTKRIDPATGLFPQYLQPLPNVENPVYPDEMQRIWTTMNVASDFFPFYAIAAYLTDRNAYDTTVRNVLRREMELTTTASGLPTHYLLDEKKPWKSETHEMVFGAAEYLKDGLVPLMELTGDPIWIARARELADAILVNAAEHTPGGVIPSADAEVNGDVMQGLYRLYYVTGEERYAEFARAIADAYFKIVLPANGGLPCQAWDFAGHRPYDPKLMIRDHGNEVILGLALVYAMLCDRDRAAAEEYRPAFEKMLDRIAAEGRNADGFFYSAIDARTGAVLDDHLSDNWGYVLAAYQIHYDLHRDAKYLEPIRKLLGSLDKVADYPWEIGVDGLADSVESALYVQRRHPSPAVRRWIEDRYAEILGRQAESGYVEGTYLDGNFARTVIMTALMESAGVRFEPWRPAVRLGAQVEGGVLYIAASVEDTVAGSVRFDAPRWRTILNLPADHARINEWPSWWAAEPDGRYRLVIRDGAGKVLADREAPGSELIAGIKLAIGKGETRYLTVEALANELPAQAAKLGEGAQDHP